MIPSPLLQTGAKLMFPMAFGRFGHSERTAGRRRGAYLSPHYEQNSPEVVQRSENTTRKTIGTRFFILETHKRSALKTVRSNCWAKRKMDL